MVQAVSKNKLADWYQNTAIQQIRAVDLGALTSKRYWEKWDRVSETDLRRVAQAFFDRLWRVESPAADCLLFDTTNYYTYMAGQTPSELARRGNNKAGKHSLRQIGLGLLVARDSRLPLYYSVYPGNLHDSKHFEAVMDEMFGVVCGLNRTKERLTVVIDKGMNADGNYAWIDEQARIHFITTYSTYFAQELAATPLERFEPVDTPANRRLIEQDQEEECLLAYRTKGEYWGKERAVIVTYNPASARKQAHAFDDKLEAIRQELLSMRAKLRDRTPHWRAPGAIRERYLRFCERLHMPSELYELMFEQTPDGFSMAFRKNAYLVARKQAYTFDDKLEAIRQELLSMRAKLRDRTPHWREPGAIRERYLRFCERLHMPSELYDLFFEQTRDGFSMTFRKNVYLVERKQSMFGKNIIITDNTDWPTSDIIQASLDRWQVEDRFRLSKDDDLVGASPIRHWTDSKIRCHLFTCVVAMTYLRRIELKMAAAGIKRTAADVMQDMRRLHYVLSIPKGARKPHRRLETPSKTQAEVLSAFGHRVDASGVLQQAGP
jgi:transposase